MRPRGLEDTVKNKSAAIKRISTSSKVARILLRLQSRFEIKSNLCDMCSTGHEGTIFYCGSTKEGTRALCSFSVITRARTCSLGEYEYIMTHWPAWCIMR